jgi:dienelactone hydrolase
MNKIDIQTRDGICPSYLYRPVAGGPWPAPVYDADAAERHWRSLTALFDATLKHR